jgi:hypothetical protein
MPAPASADFLATPELARLLGLQDPRRLRERLHRLRVPFKGPRSRPRWDVERARLALGR